MTDPVGFRQHLELGDIHVLPDNVQLGDLLTRARGISLSIPERARLHLYQRIRGLLYTGRLPALLARFLPAASRTTKRIVGAAAWSLLRLPVPSLPTTRLPRWAILSIIAVGLVNWLYLIATR